MKLYAATTTGQTSPAAAMRAGFRNILMSYAEGERVVLNTVFECRKKEVGFFLDSGAFAVFTRGAVIRIDDYIAFCKRVESLVDSVACLDVIGDDSATMRNQERMEAAGLSPLVTCHYGMKPEQVLERLDGRSFGALGGMATKDRSGREMRQRWLDSVFNGLMKSSAWPIRLHGYGMTDTVLIERYPWFSVDSTTWAMSAVYGNEMVYDGRHLVQRASTMHPQRGSTARVARAARSGQRIADFGEYCTRLWEKRGIRWD